MTIFLNYSAQSGRFTRSASRNNGVVCDDTTDFLDSVILGQTATCSDVDVECAISALEDGNFLSGYDVDQGKVEFLHGQLKELLK